ncbi:MAG: aminofutalosine synthase MqnE [Verrucomicrobia bacterium]|nr:aminofutalosine synthase MqnE [Verrucomicrobiota bacterium]
MLTRLKRRLIEGNRLSDIHEKVENAVRLSDEDALRLYELRDLNALAFLANIVRARKNGDKAFYILNRHINYSNICILSCQFCSFACRKKGDGAYEFTIEEIVGKASHALRLGITEIHIVGGLHPTLKFEHYEQMLRALKNLNPLLHIKAFTAIEILHLAWIGRLKVGETLERLRAAGLDSLTGGGAEIFSPRVRTLVCRGKETAEEWLDVHRLWHRMGGRSTCTMLYGHVETIAERVDHLRMLRAFQDETGGFTAFVPLPFHPSNNRLSHIPEPTGFENLRNLAIPRLYLDNFDHIKCYWVNHGLKLAQVSLGYGVDDLDGTVLEERIYHTAGAKTPQEQTAADLVRAIREAGRIPVQRDSLYREIQPPHGWIAAGCPDGQPAEEETETGG